METEWFRECKFRMSIPVTMRSGGMKERISGSSVEMSVLKKLIVFARRHRMCWA